MQKAVLELRYLYFNYIYLFLNTDLSIQNADISYI